MRIVITGADGFIGKNLQLRLVELGHADVVGITHLIRLPNVFGKWCKPNYNSAVATFCHNIARGEHAVAEE